MSGVPAAFVFRTCTVARAVSVLSGTPSRPHGGPPPLVLPPPPPPPPPSGTISAVLTHALFPRDFPGFLFEGILVP